MRILIAVLFGLSLCSVPAVSATAKKIAPKKSVAEKDPAAVKAEKAKQAEADKLKAAEAAKAKQAETTKAAPKK